MACETSLLVRRDFVLQRTRQDFEVRRPAVALLQRLPERPAVTKRRQAVALQKALSIVRCFKIEEPKEVVTCNPTNFFQGTLAQLT